MKNQIKYFFQKIHDLFLWASGAELKILKQVPIDQNKYFGIGGTIIPTTTSIRAEPTVAYGQVSLGYKF